MQPIDKILRNYQSMIVSGAIILFCVIALIFAVIPSVQKIQEMFVQVSDIAAEAEGLQKKLNVLNALDEQTLRFQLASVLTAVPGDRSFPSLFETVEGVAARTGVVVQQMGLSGGTTLATPSAAKLSAADRKLGARTVPFSVTVNGSISAVQEFITLAPNVRRLLRIRTFAIAFPPDERPLTVSIEMDAFYEPLPTSLGTAKTILPELTAADNEIIERLGNMELITQSAEALPEPFIGQIKPNPFVP
jgi:hypothetical protein